MNTTSNIALMFCAMFLFTFHIISYALDTIYMNQILREGETIISSGGSFELGFFSPETSNNRYVGIWYKNISVRTVVWVANRETPLTNTSGLLRLMHPGILVLQDHAKGSIVWSTNTSRGVINPSAELLDSGNLVVKDADDNDSIDFLWQSFNYPTDTLLPGMKLGWNFVTNLEVYLSSWKSSEDLARGEFTYHCEPAGYPQNVLRKGGVEQYRTGPWNGLRFSGLPYMRQNPIFQYGLVISKNEVYYHYELLSPVISRLTLSLNGFAQRWTWTEQTQLWFVHITSPNDNCDSYKLCGAYGDCNVDDSPVCSCLNRFIPKDMEGWEKADWSKGCIRRKPLNCEKGDKFLKQTGIKLPDTQKSWYNASMTLKECKMFCSRNCSCMAYASLDISRGESGCLIWYDELIDIKELPAEGQDIYIRMASSESDMRRREAKSAILIASVSLLAGIVLIGVSLMFFCVWRKKKLDGPERDTGRLSTSDERQNKDLELPMFDFFTITKATNNFSNDNKLGEGGYGPVYKGLLEEGQEIAVKRLSRTSFQGIDEFKNEVICFAKLQHRNLVKLLGCCIQGEEKILLYEYMTNKSLDLILFDPADSIILDWPKRSNIINGIARGLLYLHQDSRLRIIHRDLKASNILLDSEMNPKISDFGLARTFGGNETGANTSRIVGTYGYMSPEYAVDGLFSVKSDVFSFGVLVLEIVSGKRNRGFSHKDHHLNLLGHAWMLYREGKTLEIIDSNIESAHYLPELARSIHVGLLCVQQSPEDRPTMSSVVLMLGNEGVLPEAKQPGFFTERNVKHAETLAGSNTGYTASSINEMSVTQTQLQGR